MAPIVGLKRSQLLRLLGQENAEKALPIQLNWMGPAGVVVCENGIWMLKALRCNEEAAEAEHQKRVAHGDTHWMPEHTWPYFEPDETLVEGEDKETFVTAIEEMDWPFTPEEFEADEARLGRIADSLAGMKNKG